MMLRHLIYLLLGAIAGLIVGIIPSSILVAIFDNDIYGVVLLVGFILAGAILGVMRREVIEIFFDGLLELITI